MMCHAIVEIFDRRLRPFHLALQPYISQHQYSDSSNSERSR